ncbi:MAG: phosphoribosylamine--glycine ligase [Eubacteriales bacterium]|nr:phosphoribosylamine--glycine ligase [Eubacteriales bacterium]MDD4390504.1 phosphoribosylamine--glycine ligase [Eubacteriales bacterium]
MNVLVVGGGGREQAICWKLSQSPKVDKLFCLPGNAGITQFAECFPIRAEDIEGICEFVRGKDIGLAVIGPEVPLAMGLTDELETLGITVFGPNKKCAQLEASKAFTKQFLARHDIPTAGYREFTNKDEILESIGIFGYPMVIKADGLAAGKGVVIAEDEESARVAIEEMMGNRIFGDAGDKIVVEEYLSGIEASILCFVDEHSIVPMESAQDYKRIFDGDKGPNTGGMGTYSPSLVIDDTLKARINSEILEPTLKGFQKDGLDFKGVLFVGLMLSEEGPKVIEFNNRFGDPETQSILRRLESDLLEIFLAVCDNRLSEIEIKWRYETAVCVVMAAEGYPGAYRKGDIISGLENADNDIVVFHAGTARDHDGNVVTSGGRVLGVTAIGATHEEARNAAYAGAERIGFKGAQYRKDIGLINRR